MLISVNTDVSENGGTESEIAVRFLDILINDRPPSCSSDDFLTTTTDCNSTDCENRSKSTTSRQYPMTTSKPKYNGE